MALAREQQISARLVREEQSPSRCLVSASVHAGTLSVHLSARQDPISGRGTSRWHSMGKNPHCNAKCGVRKAAFLGRHVRHYSGLEEGPEGVNIAVRRVHDVTEHACTRPARCRVWAVSWLCLCCACCPSTLLSQRASESLGLPQSSAWGQKGTQNYFSGCLGPWQIWVRRH